MNFAIVSDGACELGKSWLEEHQVQVVPFYVTLDGITYQKENDELSLDDFYRHMVEEHVIPKTSLPSVGDYLKVFEPLAEAGIPILCICLASVFSGSYNSAVTAADALKDDYPDCRIHVIDSTQLSASQGLFVHEAVRMRDNGLSFDTSYRLLEMIKETGRVFFTIGSMEYLIANGRIGTLTGTVVEKLGIRPIIDNKGGGLNVIGMARGRKRSIVVTLDCVKKFLSKVNIDDYIFLPSYGTNPEEFAEFVQTLKDYLHIEPLNIPTRIGATIASHGGPDVIGIACIRRYDAVTE